MDAKEVFYCYRCDKRSDYHVSVAGDHLKAICSHCGRYLRFIPKKDALRLENDLKALQAEEQKAKDKIDREQGEIAEIHKQLNFLDETDKEFPAVMRVRGLVKRYIALSVLYEELKKQQEKHNKTTP